MAVGRFRRLILGPNLLGTDNGDGTITLEATGGVTTLAKNGSTGLQGAVTLSGGSGVTLTQAGQDIAIAAIAAAGSSVLLYDYTVAGSDKASIDTNSDGSYAGALSGGYMVLDIYVYARTDEAVVGSGVDVILNNDTGANYDRQYLLGVNTTASAGKAAAAAALQTSVAGASNGANVFGALMLTMHNYAGTVGYKTIRMEGLQPDTVSTNMLVALQSWQYRSTSAVNRVKIVPTTAAKKFKVGTRLTILAR